MEGGGRRGVQGVSSEGEDEIDREESESLLRKGGAARIGLVLEQDGIRKERLMMFLPLEEPPE